MTQLSDTGFVQGTHERETEKAFLFSWTTGVTRFGSKRSMWVPKSIITWLEPQGCMAPTAHVPAWWIRKNNYAFRY